MWWGKPNSNKAPAKEPDPFPFMKIRWVGFLFTAAVFIVTTWSLWANGLNMGLDFTGGVQVEASRDTPFDPAVVRQAVTAAGFEESSVTTSDGNRVIVRVPLEADDVVEEVGRRVQGALGEGVKIEKTDNVSGKVSGELFEKGVMAAILAVVGIGAYVWIRFEFKFGTGAFITTFHDVYAVVGFFSLTQMTFDLTIVAGVLTVAGYSINDTVVVYDRIREMLKKFKKLPIEQVIDIAITATLPRTIMTSFATLLAAGAMAFLGGQVLFGFAISIIFGIVIGTYSSIFVAAPLLIHLPGKIPGAKYREAESRSEAAVRP
jgi:preprotein translocase subunit SecF